MGRSWRKDAGGSVKPVQLDRLSAGNSHTVSPRERRVSPVDALLKRRDAGLTHATPGPSDGNSIQTVGRDPGLLPLRALITAYHLSLMMGSWQPVTKLRDYVSHNPPVVTFLLCLLTLAVSFICLGFYSHTHTLPNPDVAKDWNVLLSSLSKLQLCEGENTSSSELRPAATTPLAELDNVQTSPVNSTESSSSITHLHLRVPVTVTVRPEGGSVRDVSLHTTVTASQLKIGGAEEVSLTLEFVLGNSSQTCLTISAPAHLLPATLLPPGCPASDASVAPLHVETSENVAAASQTCFSLQSENDPTLTVMLTHEEQSMAVRHLLELSVFLLVVCVLLCVSVSLTHSLSRQHKWNGLDLQNEPLIES